MSSFLIRLTTAVSVAALLTGCAVAPNKFLNADSRSKLGTPETVAAVQQPQIYAQIVVSNTGAAVANSLAVVPGIGILLAVAAGAAGGAVDAGINASRQKAADVEVTPVRNSLQGYNFNTELQAALDASLAPKLPTQKTRVVSTVSEAEYTSILKATPQPSVLFATADYHLTPNFDALEIFMRGVLHPKLDTAEASFNLAAAHYHNDFSYRLELAQKAETIEANRAQWLADNASTLRKALGQGISELTSALASDLAQNIDAGAKPVVTGTPYKNGFLTGTLVSSEASVQRIRMDNGFVHIKGDWAALQGAPVPVAAPVMVAAVVAQPVVVPAVVEAAAAPVVVVAAPAAPVVVAVATVAPPVPVPAVAVIATPTVVAIAAPAAISTPQLRASTTLRLQPKVSSPLGKTLAAGIAVTPAGSTSNGDGQWMFVKAAEGMGWVRPDDVIGLTP